MITIPPTTPPTIPPITPPERPFWVEDDELLPESPAPADVELLFVVVGVGMPPAAVPVAVAEFPPLGAVPVEVAEFPPLGEVVAVEEGATVPVIWTS
jgi:hypothetical protein